VSHLRSTPATTSEGALANPAVQGAALKIAAEEIPECFVDLTITDFAARGEFDLDEITAWCRTRVCAWRMLTLASRHHAAATRQARRWASLLRGLASCKDRESTARIAITSSTKSLLPKPP
jgi:hypothetical protein